MRTQSPLVGGEFMGHGSSASFGDLQHRYAPLYTAQYSLHIVHNYYADVQPAVTRSRT